MPEINKGIKEEDRSGIEALLRTSWKDRGFSYTQKWAEQYLQQVHTSELKKEQWFSVKEQNKVVGIVAVLLKEGNVAELRDFVVKKELRRKGYGKKLLEHVIDWCRINNIRKIYTLVPQHARGFFEKEGFKMEGFLRSHIKQGEDLLLMSLFPEKKPDQQMNLKEKLDDMKNVEAIEEETSARLRKLNLR